MVPALLIILVTVLASACCRVLMQMKLSREIMEKGAKQSGLSFALITGVQKIKLAGAEKRAFARWANSYSEAAELSYNPPLFIKVNTAITRPSPWRARS